MAYQNVFIIGSPRSGTSLFRMLIGSHSSVVVPPECGFIQWWYETYKDWNVSNSKSDDDVDRFIANLKKSKKIETWELDFASLRELIRKEEPTSYGELASLVILQYGFQNKGQVKILGDKNNYYIHHLDLLNEIYPDAKYLVIVRDCRDVVCSCLNVNSLVSNSEYKPQFPPTAKGISSDWYNNNTKILSFLETIDTSKYAVVRYEDLLVDPQKALEKCSEVLDIRFENQMLDYYKNNMEPTALLDWKKKTNERIDQGNTQKYLEQLSVAEISEVMSVSGDLMTDFGYR